MQPKSPRLPAPSASSSMSRSAKLSALAIALCLSLADANAQQPGPGDHEDSSWGLGIGVINMQKPYKGMDRETKALPMISFENEYVKVGGLGLEVKLPGLDLGESNRIKFGILGKLELGGYEASDSPFLAGMAEREGGFWAGAKAEWENELVDVSAQWTGDMSGHSEGRQFSLGLEKNFRLSDKVMLVPHAAAHWLDKKYVDYYYGVHANEATASRGAYTGKAGVNMEVGLRAMYHIDRNHGVLFDVSVTSLAKGIKDSTLVDRSSTNRVLLGYKYSF
jgi:outer membrane protein